MSFVVGRLGLAPAAYWAMTPRELSVVLAPHVGPAPLRAADLAALAARYPDRPPA
ncbi:phage tail assembly chaperone [Hyphomicrobiaceae bacterium 22]|uniref:Phage tail assembly chaperone n=1 Tax=Prosthecodimorpha staleyi TaxID=2840188 RepID=A0A947D959_9HYPH|nr:phage tail assembly chaperone [Prosthecodimorpha staleyi]